VVAIRVVWSDEAIDDLAALVGRNRRRAKVLYDTVERMGRLGWRFMGRRTRDGLLYFPVEPFGVLYDLRDDELHVVGVVDARVLARRP
jgi:hypothetical protein